MYFSCDKVTDPLPFVFVPLLQAPQVAKPRRSSNVHEIAKRFYTTQFRNRERCAANLPAIPVRERIKTINDKI